MRPDRRRGPLRRRSTPRTPTTGSDVYYWNTPTSPVPRRAHRRRVRAVLGVGHGVERSAFLAATLTRGMTPVTTTTATPRGFGYRHPRMRLAGLLTAPMAWLVVVYLGSLFALFITAFWTVDDFTGQLVRTFTLENFQQVFTNSAYLRRRCVRTIGIALLGHAVLPRPRAAAGVLHGPGGEPEVAAAARGAGPHPAVGVLPRQGLRLARDAAARDRRRGRGSWTRSA